MFWSSSKPFDVFCFSHWPVGRTGGKMANRSRSKRYIVHPDAHSSVDCQVKTRPRGATWRSIGISFNGCSDLWLFSFQPYKQRRQLRAFVCVSLFVVDRCSRCWSNRLVGWSVRNFRFNIFRRCVAQQTTRSGVQMHWNCNDRSSERFAHRRWEVMDQPMRGVWWINAEHTDDIWKSNIGRVRHFVDEFVAPEMRVGFGQRNCNEAGRGVLIDNIFRQPPQTVCCVHCFLGFFFALVRYSAAKFGWMLDRLHVLQLQDVNQCDNPPDGRKHCANMFI